MITDIKIRTAKPTADDALAINVMRQHLTRIQTSFNNNAVGFPNKDIKAVDIAAPNSIFLIAEDNNKYTYGYAELELRRHDTVRVLQIKGIYVDGKHRQEGFGSELVDAAVCLAKTLGCSQIQTSVLYDNTEAVDFFHGCGMRGIITTLTMNVED